MKLTSLPSIVLILLATAAVSQDIHFSQFYTAPLLQNPGMTGATFDHEADINYKDQWRSVASPYKTFALAWHMKAGKGQDKKGHWGLGTLLYRDKAGDAGLGTLQAGLYAAYHVKMGGYSTLGLGLNGSFFHRSIVTTELQWGNQYSGGAYNGQMASGEPVASLPPMNFMDGSAGLVYNFEKGEVYISAQNHFRLQAGMAVHHLFGPGYSFYGGEEKLYRKYTGHLNANIGIKNSSVSLVPALMYSRQGTAQELLFGTSFRYLLREESKYTGFVKGASFSLGAYYRNKDAVALTALLEFSQYSLGFSYDLNTSDLKSASDAKGGFEISLRFVNPNPFTYKRASRI